MAAETFAVILDRIKGHTDHLCLHVLGEPLLHPELDLLLALCHQQNLRVNLTTNGTLLGQWQDTLLASPALRQVNISLHSFEEQANSNNLSVYLAGVLAVVHRLRVETETYVSLRLWNGGAEDGDRTTRRNNSILEGLETYFALPYRLAEVLSERGVALAPRVYLSQAARFTWPHAPGPDQGGRGMCRGLKDHLAILVDGTVVPCCLDSEGDAELGNILARPLAEIIAAPRATAISQGFARQLVVEPLCRRCSFRQRF